jgi:hypothetical protein
MRFPRAWLGVCILVANLLPDPLAAQADEGPFARIAFLRPHDGETTEFEAGYIRHLAWHRGADDPFLWYGYTVLAGERARLFVYATFGHSAAALSNPVSPSEDERDNIFNVTPYAEFLGGGIYEFLPSASFGSAKPTPRARLEFVTITLEPGSERAFETALSSARSLLREETLWYRMVAGGRSPTYVRLRSRGTLTEILERRSEQSLPAGVANLVETINVQIMNFRPTLSYRVAPAAP